MIGCGREVLHLAELQEPWLSNGLALAMAASLVAPLQASQQAFLATWPGIRLDTFPLEGDPAHEEVRVLLCGLKQKAGKRCRTAKVAVVAPEHDVLASPLQGFCHCF